MFLRKSLRGRKNGAPRGTRTHDPLIKNQLLYQLSYRRPMCAAPKGTPQGPAIIGPTFPDSRVFPETPLHLDLNPVDRPRLFSINS